MAKENPLDRPEYMEILGLSPPYAMEDVKKAYRDRVMQVHPDQGGSRDEFDQLQDAFDQASKHLETRVDRREWIAGQVDSYVVMQDVVEVLDRLGAEVRLNNADSPLEAEVTLQQAIRGWDFAVQKQTLEMKINQLLIARMKMPRQLMPFVNEYGRILQNYVTTRQRIESFKPRRGRARPRLEPMVDEAVRQLDSVGRRLVLFKPEPTTPAPAALPQN